MSKKTTPQLSSYGRKNHLSTELKRIEKLYLDEDLTGDDDYKGAGGYWDLAGSLAAQLSNKEFEYDNLQTGFYRALRETFV